jgi:hypothetical protein
MIPAGCSHHEIMLAKDRGHGVVPQVGACCVDPSILKRRSLGKATLFGKSTSVQKMTIAQVRNVAYIG